MKDFSVAIYGNLALQPEAWQARFHEEVARAGGLVRFHGRYQPDELPELMARTDWVVMPSIWWENAPLVIGEALHHRRPVICSDIGGMAEHVRDGRDGLHFRASDAQHLAEIMLEAMDSPKIWEELHQRLSSPPTLITCLEHYLQLYQSSEPLLLGKDG